MPTVPAPDTTNHTGTAKGKVAYVLSGHPSLSGTFILREILALEAEGLEVVRISINSPAAYDLLSPGNRDEVARTHYVKSTSWRALAGMVLRAVRTSPVQFARVAWLAMRSGHADGREILWRGFYLAEAVVVWDVCRREDIRHLHAHFGQGSAAVAWFACELANRLQPERPRSTWSFTVHGWLEFLNEHADAIKEKVESADMTIAITDHCRSQLMRLSDPSVWDRIRVARCGVDIERFEYRPHPPRHDPPRILMVARFAPEKGHIVLFEAVRLLVDAGRPVEVLLAGAGAFRSTLDAKVAELDIGDYVRFLGPLGQDDIPAALDDADVFVLPSFSEGLPVALMEALAAGTPAVATAITGVSELIEDGVTGRLVRASRADLLAEAILSLVDDADLRARVQAEGRRRIDEEFTMATVGPRVADLFGELLGRSTVGPRTATEPAAVMRVAPTAEPIPGCASAPTGRVTRLLHRLKR